MKVVVLTTSYPRHKGDVAGHFVAAAVEDARSLGVDVEVVSPDTFPSFGIAYGDGIVQNLRRAPWKAAFAPAFLAAFARAARSASRDADLVHAHWLPTASVALATGKPYVLQLWGTDVALADRLPPVARPFVRRARLVIASSPFLAGAASDLGARATRIVEPGVAPLTDVAEPDEPPHVLFAGRLSEEKGIRDFVAATAGLARVIVGDGPLRDEAPDARGFVPTSQMPSLYAKAAVVCVPSRREGYGMVAREAMAAGRPVVVTAVGGLADVHGDGVLHVPVGDVAALRGAIERLLHDPVERARRGAAAAATAKASFSRAASAEALVDAYRAALTIDS